MSEEKVLIPASDWATLGDVGGAHLMRKEINRTGWMAGRSSLSGKGPAQAVEP